MKKKVNSCDVAQAAGVSRTTVSYILNDVKGVRISEDTRQRVLNAAKKLGYHPDINAQALKTNRSMSIGVVSRRNVSQSRFARVLEGIKDVLLKEQYSILLCSDELDKLGYPEYYKLYRQKKIDGIIFISYHEQLDIGDVHKHAESMLKENVPCVFADYHLENSLINSVDINYSHGAYISAKHLIENGYKNIYLIIPDTDTEQESQRLKGVEMAVKEADNVTLFIQKVNRTGKGMWEWDDNIEGILSDVKKHSAIIVSWSHIALITLYYINKMRIDVPKDIAVISLADDLPLKLTYPKLSACVLPLYDLGLESAKMLIDNLNTPMPKKNLMLPCSLKIRDSS